MDRPHFVLDLSDERGQLCGGMLASLAYWGWNRGKRSIVVDVATDQGRAELLDLASRADVVVESGAVPIDLALLRRSNPQLVTVGAAAARPVVRTVHGLG